jgi:hypothetical protein
MASLGMEAPRTVLTTRAVRCASETLAHDESTISALARHLGVDWHTCRNAVEVEAEARVASCRCEAFTGHLLGHGLFGTPIHPCEWGVLLATSRRPAR